MSDHPASSTVVLVTGGTKGVGKEIAATFLDAGASVATCARREPEDVSGVDRAAWFVPADLRDPESVDALISAIEERFGRLDVVINNAGGSPYAETATASPRFHESIIRLNLLAPLFVAQRANAVMQAQETGGVILNIASVSGTRPSPGTAAYGAAKAGLINLTQTLAVEWAPKVRVNAIVAGLIDTGQSHLHYGDAGGVAAVAATVPLARLGRPRDIAEACLWLASERAAYVSGAALVLHGGGERPAYLSAASPDPGPGK